TANPSKVYRLTPSTALATSLCTGMTSKRSSPTPSTSWTIVSIGFSLRSLTTASTTSC
ncbi:hypothetical protein BGZ52_007506, partial [Haplosporangium bisporale]